MKSITAYYFLLIYSIAVLHPVFPLISDFVNHNFSEAIHITAIHSIYGENHAEVEVAKRTDASNENGKSEIIFLKIFDSFHIIHSNISLVVRQYSVQDSYSTYLQKNISSLYYDSLINPPDLV